VPQPLKEFLRTRFVASSPAGLLGMAAGLREEPDRVVDLAAAGVPCLVVAGQWDDAWSVPEQREMARRLQAPFALIPGAAHSPNTENPAGLLDVLLPAWRSWLH
jgi:pimeloyl-ACP methyl ester carboxylesterase